MIILENVAQGSAEWHQARLGVATASCFGKIVTPGGKLSSQRTGYMNQLLAEWALGQPQDELPDLYWIERGKALEPEARAFYTFSTDTEARQVGFIYRDDDKLVGCSPDWLCGDEGGAEVKCPASATHIGYLLGEGIADTYRPQVQGCLWVTGLQWWDTLSYHPDLPPALVRVEPDEKYQAALDAAIPVFLEEMREARDRLRKLGVEPGAFKVEILDASLSDLVDQAGLPLNPLG